MSKTGKAAPAIAPGFKPPAEWPKFCETCGAETEPAILRYDAFSGEPRYGMFCVNHRILYVWDPEDHQSDDEKWFLSPVAR